MSEPGPLFKNLNEDYDKNEPWYDDVLDRRAIAKTLTPFINSITQPFVISIDAPYGGGKTFFLKNWHYDLNEQGYRTVYFNAWESDFTADPLAAFMASISSQIAEFGKGGTSDSGKPAAWEKAEKLAEVLIHRGLPLGIRVVGRKLLGEEGIEEFRSLLDAETEGHLIDALANASGDLIEDFQKQQDGLDTFREYLSLAIKESTNELSAEKKKLIIFVDELDRCRPTYAVEVLERIKHLFCVDGAVFILGMNEEQIANAMAAVFGNGLEKEGYLRRFIDWRFRLPKPSGLQYSEFLFHKFDFANIPRFSADNTGDRISAATITTTLHRPPLDNNTGDYIKDDIDQLAPAHGIFAEGLDLTLRQQEQCYTEFNLYLRTLKPNKPVFCAVLGVIGVLRVKKRDLLNNAFFSEEGRDALDAYLSERIDFKRQKIWDCGNWELFSPIFRAWFYSGDDEEFIAEKLKNKHIEYNKMKQNGPEVDYEIYKNYEFWGMCERTYRSFYHDAELFLGKPLAQIIMDRLESVDQLLPRLVR